MFTIGSNYKDSHFFIHNRQNVPKRMYLHCDGRVINVCEYFETKEDAQAVLDKFYPKPKHVWKHGDIFENSEGMWIYLKPVTGVIVVYLKGSDMGGTPKIQLDGAKFLFNIREKI